MAKKQIGSKPKAESALGLSKLDSGNYTASIRKYHVMNSLLWSSRFLTMGLYATLA
jgi:hypothetical protein